jgi:hypothetical protein
MAKGAKTGQPMKPMMPKKDMPMKPPMKPKKGC